MLSFSGLSFVLFCFLTTVCALFSFHFSSFFVSLAMSHFPSVFVPLSFSRCFESTLYVFSVFSFRMVFFYLVTTDWIFYISLRENSVNHSINDEQDGKQDGGGADGVGASEGPSRGAAGRATKQTTLLVFN